MNVAVGALAVVAGQLIPAFTKRGDRKHEDDLEFEKRVWEDKRAALLAVIRWAKGIQRETAPNTEPIRAHYPRADVLFFAAFNPLEPGDELTAFTGQEVQRRYERLKGLLDSAMTVPVNLLLSQLKSEDQTYKAAIQEHLKATQVEGGDLDFQAMSDAGTAASRAMVSRNGIEQIASKLDPDQLHRLAGELLVAANQDLRGGRGYCN